MKTVTSTWGGETAPQQPADPPGGDGDPSIASPWAAPLRRTHIEDVPLPPMAESEPATPAVFVPAAVPAPSPAVDDHDGTWLYAEEHLPERASALDAWLTAPIPRRRGARVAPPGTRRPRKAKAPRRPGMSLAALVFLSLVAAFFAWVSVEPLWLAIGHGDRGTATVTTCTGKGVGQRCVGEFTAADGGFTVAKVAMLGVEEDARRAGTTVTARMVSSDGRSAYSGGRLSLHLRWMIGLVLVLACGLGIAVATGATRLDGRRARLGAFTISLAAPLLIVVGFLAMSF